jgi:CO/xanthine dehydrogenase Mo-binding subunit
MVCCIERKVQEVAMAATKKIGKRFVRWFKTVREQNRPPYRHHEHSLYDA